MVRDVHAHCVVCVDTKSGMGEYFENKSGRKQEFWAENSCTFCHLSSGRNCHWKMICCYFLLLLDHELLTHDHDHHDHHHHHDGHELLNHDHDHDDDDHHHHHHHDELLTRGQRGDGASLSGRPLCRLVGLRWRGGGRRPRGLGSPLE